MKGVVLLLLTANLAVFGWLYTHQDDYRPRYEAQAKQLSPTIERLLLLNERVVTEQISSPVEPRSAEVAVPDASAKPSADMVVEIENPRIETLTDDSPAVAATTPEPNKSSAPPQPPARHCQTVGPFIDQANIDVLVGELKVLGVAASQRTVQVQQPSGFWVYLPAMQNAEAQRIVDELAKKGVEDYFLGRQNSISLGIFSDKRTAETRMQEIISLGYEARLEQRYLTREVYWLDLEEQGDKRISEDRWQTFLGPREDVRRQSLACE